MGRLIFIMLCSLPSVLSDFELSDRLSQVLGAYGKIVNVKASRDARGRPFAFVQFEGQVIDFLLTETVTVEDRVLRFERAKSTFNAHQQQSNPMPHPQQQQIPVPFYPPYHHPMFAPPPAQTSFMVPLVPGEDVVGLDDPSVNNSNKIFVGHLNGDLVTQRKLLRRFQRHGHITDIELFKRNIDGTPRKDAFAFISYLTEEQQFAAIREENDQEWLGSRLKCCKALPKRDQRDTADESVASSNTSMSAHSAYYYPAPPHLYYPPYPPGPGGSFF